MKQIAEREHRLGNFPVAKTEYENHLKDYPEDHEAWYGLGILFAQCKQFPEAYKAIECAIQCNKNQASYHNSLGNVQRQLQQYEDALKSYKKAIKINPNYASAYNNLGTLYYQQKRLLNAEQAYKKAISFKDDYADAHCNLGILYAGENKETEAVDHLEKALHIQPHLLTALNQLGDLYLRQNNVIAARDLFLKSVQYFSHQTESQHRLGICYFKLKDYPSAKIQFQTTLNLDSKHAEANQYLANTFLELRKHEEALHYYFRQLEIAPFYETYYNLGVMLMMKERYREALLYFDQAALLNNQDPALELNKGHIFLKRGESTRAVDAYKKALLLKPHDPEIIHILSALSQKNIPDAAPAEFVSNLFDQYAPYYDYHLTDRLLYTTPDKMMDIIKRETPDFFDTQKRILDLGCGTGLCGVLLKPYATELIGVDLSHEMLRIARQKQCYDALIENDIALALKEYKEIDLLVAADVFTYMGDLDAVFKQAVSALSENGLFIFSTEKTFDQPFVLQPSIRYAHSQSYLIQLAEKYGFELLCCDNTQLRKHKADWVEGYIVLLKLRSMALS